MARFERSRESRDYRGNTRRDFRGGSSRDFKRGPKRGFRSSNKDFKGVSKRDFRGNSRGDGNSRRRDSGGSSRDFRGPGRPGGSYSRDRRESTRVKCSSCGSFCEVPFRPTMNKPVYCGACFGRKENAGHGLSERDIDIINEKLNKIMKALDIE